MRRPNLDNLARRAIVAAAAIGATLLVAAPLRAQSAAAEPLDPARLAAEQIATLVGQMGDATSDQDARDLAARRLLTIGRSEARSAVKNALSDPANPGGRLAAARAIAEDLPADPQFIDPLFVALDVQQPRELADAAAVALANHKMLPDVSRRLVGLTAGTGPQSEALRVAATRALAGQIEKPAGERLVQLAADPSPLVAKAAIESLQTFASLPLTTAREWADWWRGQSSLSEDRFRLETLTARASRFELQARRGDDTYLELRRTVLAQLAATPRDQLADAMVKLFASTRDAVRLIAARQAFELASTGDLPQTLRPALQNLLADPLADVRVMAARTVPLLGDPDGSFGALARQAAVEPDSRVRVALVVAIGSTGNVAAVPVLTAMLDDASTPVVQAAAQALAAAGPALAAQSPGRAADLADRLQTVLRARVGAANDPVMLGLRESLIEALVPLRQQSLRPMYQAMLNGAQPREPESIRRLAAMGFAALADPRNVWLLSESLIDESPAVRLQVVRAMRSSSGDFSEIAGSLYNRMNPAREADARVRTAAWDAIKSLLPAAPLQQLQTWSTPQKFPLVYDDLNKRLDVLLALAAKAEATREKDIHSVALQSIGDTQRELGLAAEKLGDLPGAAARLAEAAVTYRSALAISREPQVVQKLILSTVDALLLGRDYAGATKFAAEIFAGPNGQQYQGDVLPAFRIEAERLSKPTERQDDALRLIDAAVAMPGVPGEFRVELLKIQTDVQARQRNRNDAWWMDPTIGLASAR